MRNKYFDIYWENPFKTYNKVKKWFLPIKPKFSWGFHKANSAKILEFNSFDLMWKDKWNTPRHEFNPRIELSLFNYIHLNIDFTTGDSFQDMCLWEAILDWLYYNKSLQEACTTGWCDWDEKTKSYVHIEVQVLKEPYHTMFKNNELNNLYYDGNIEN